MTTIYFPFTLPDARAVEAWTAVLGPLTLVSPYAHPPGNPLGDLVDRGLVRWRTPAGSGDRELQAAVAECLEWGRQHRKGVRDFLTVRRERVPLAPAETPREIADRIRGTSAPPQPPKRERLLRARVFLALAEARDAQEREVGADLNALQLREADMFQALRGEADDASVDLAPGPPPAAAAPPLLAERVQAWAVLAEALLEEAGASPFLLVTDHREAFELARERLAPETEAPRWFPWPRPDQDLRGLAWLKAEWTRSAEEGQADGSSSGGGMVVAPLAVSPPETLFDWLAGGDPAPHGRVPRKETGGYLAWMRGPFPGNRSGGSPGEV
jgi:hypothetical protein